MAKYLSTYLTIYFNLIYSELIFFNILALMLNIFVI